MRPALGRGLRPSQRAQDAVGQIRSGNRFGQHAIEMNALGGAQQIVAAVCRRHEDDRHLRNQLQLGLLPDFAGQSDAVHHRHLPVGEHQPEGVIGATGLTQVLQCFCRRRRFGDAALPGAQQFAQNMPRSGFVIGNQHAQAVYAVNRPRLARVGRHRVAHLEAESASLTEAADDADLAAHQLYQPLADGQAEAGAAVAAGDRTIGLGEGREQLFYLSGRHADAGIQH